MARGRGIHPNTGEVMDHPPQLGDGWQSIFSDEQYHRVKARPFIDGVFVPDDRRKSVQLDSAGHVFRGFGTSDGRVFDYIWAGGEIPSPITSIPAMLNDIDYGSDEHSVLGMSSNKGITFDLEGIRRTNPGYDIVRFGTVVGNIEYVPLPAGENTSADVWVFVDGRLRFCRRNLDNASRSRTAIPILIRIGKKECFLTLVVSDAGNSICGDRVVFGDPRLNLVRTNVEPASSTSKTR